MKFCRNYFQVILLFCDGCFHRHTFLWFQFYGELACLTLRNFNYMETLELGLPHVAAHSIFGDEDEMHFS